MNPPFSAQFQSSLQPLIAAGLTRDQASQILVAFSPLIQNIFEHRVRQTFSVEEISALNQSGTDPSSADSVAKLEQEYEAKTGQGFLDLYRGIVAELVPLITQALADTKDSWNKLAALGPDEIKRLATAINTKDAAAARAILSRIQP